MPLVLTERFFAVMDYFASLVIRHLFKSVVPSSALRLASRMNSSASSSGIELPMIDRFHPLPGGQASPTPFAA